MKKIIIDIYSYLYSKNRRNRYKSSNKLMWLICNIGYRLMGYELYILLVLENLFGKTVRNLNGRRGVIVSLTTFPARIGTVWMAIDSMFQQKIKPERVRLYLSKQEFPDQEKNLPSSLRRYVGKGLEIRFVEQNLMPHKKYLYAFKDVMETNSDAVVVTIDDDIYYRDDMLEHLLNLHDSFPDCVCANEVHEIEVGQPYNSWTGRGIARCPSHKNLGLGVAGVLYPVKMFKDARMFDTSLIAKYCLKADDLWLKAFEVLNDILVVTGDFYVSTVEIQGSQAVSLKSTNTNTQAGTNNDTQWKSLNDLFGINDLLKSKRRGGC